MNEMRIFTKYFTGLFLFILASLVNSLSVYGQTDQQMLVDYVNPLIGTTGESKTEYGGRIPAVMTPFGMTQWSAMTRENKISATPYHYDDKAIIGFIGTHQPAIWMGDYGYMSFMPQTGTLRLDVKDRGMSFSHDNEISHPYYYSVTMGDGDCKITTEQTSTTRCGFFKISFPAKEQSFLSVEMSRQKGYKGFVKIIPEKRQIIGYNSDRQNSFGGKNMGPELKKLKGYFVIEFDTDFKSYGTYHHGNSKDLSIVKSDGQKEQTGEQIGAYIAFDRKSTKEVRMKIGSSFISMDQARMNLQKEIKDWDFDNTMKQCRSDWESWLSRIQVRGGTTDQKVLFYTFLCNTFMYPSIFSEYGRYYSPFDEKIHQGVSYTAYSLWDTFRALHPLFLFVAKEQVSPMITSLLNMYDEGGWIPKWPNPSYSNIMIATHSDAVIADAYVKGVRDFDVNKAYEAIYKNAMVPAKGDEIQQWADRQEWQGYEGRGGLTWYKKYGYVPADKTKESVSRTLEFAYDDYCVAQVAKGLGKMNDYKYFMNRSKNYKNVFNKESGFMQARLSDGRFASDKIYNKAFTEGSPWTYLFCAMQDVPGLVELMGGKDNFISRLDQNFKEGHYRHDNEPGHHYIYLYNYVQQPWKTQELVAEVLKTKYLNTPDGLSGNDDCGQMSAWYIFSALGFYPVCPGSEEFAIGKPLFEEAILRLDKNKTFKIKAHNLSDKNKYVKQIKLDGKVLKTPFITYSEIMKHSVLEFEMQSTRPVYRN